MRIVLNLFISLFLTVSLSFTAPIVLLGGILATLLLVSYIPGLAFLGKSGAIQILEFLAVFGSGSPLEGVVTLGLAGGVVGGLFDLFNFYRYHSLKN